MGLLEKFRRKPQPNPQIEVQIPEELTMRVTEKLLDSLAFGYLFEQRSIEYNGEDLDTLLEFGSDDEDEKDEVFEQPEDENRQYGITEGMKVVLKEGKKYYEVTVWKKVTGHIWRWENGLIVYEYDEKDLRGNYKRAVFFNPGVVDARVTNGWSSKDGREHTWSSIGASSQQTLDIYRSLMSAKVDLLATHNLFEREKERIREFETYGTIKWPEKPIQHP